MNNLSAHGQPEVGAGDTTPDAEVAARVGAGLDELAERGAGLLEVLEYAADETACSVGVTFPGARAIAAAPVGFEHPGGQPASAATRDLPGVGTVWLAADGRRWEPSTADLLLRRLTIAVKVALLSHAVPEVQPAALEAMVDEAADRSSRIRALPLLGLDERSEVTVFAVLASSESSRAFADGVRPFASSVLLGPIGRLHLLVAKDLDPDASLDVPVGVRVAFSGPSPAVDAAEAWRLAHLALRFTLPSPRPRGPYEMSEAVLIDAADMGVYAVLAESLSPQRIAGVLDVCRLNELVREQGPDMLVCLEAVSATESVRKAARQLHLHHNSIALRVERAERYLGFSFTEPYGRNRLFLALVLRRLGQSGELLQG